MKLEPRYSIPVIIYGHAGDDNVRLHPICKDMPNSTWTRKLPQLIHDIYRIGAKYGGAVSAEDGIGADNKEHVNGSADPALLQTMKKIEAAMDPNKILKPSKISDC